MFLRFGELLMKKRLMIIGIDGADWRLIQPWIADGKLPTFTKIIDNGVSGHLKSTIPPVSAPAWTSAIVGLDAPCS